MTLDGPADGAGAAAGHDAHAGAGTPALLRKATAAIVMTLISGGAIVADYYVGLDICFHVLVVLLTLKALSEFYDMCESSRTGPFRGFGIVSAVILVLFHWAATPGTIRWFTGPGSALGQDLEKLLGQELVTLGLVVAVLGALWLQATKRVNERTFVSISSTLFGILYVWFLSSFLVKLRHLGSDGILGGDDWNFTGTGLLLSCIVVSKFSDVGGYLFGRKFGRTKLIPRISPNKTWEGLAAGLALSVGVAYIFQTIGLLPFRPYWCPAVFGLVVGGMATMGDLAESLLKRGAGTKDTADLVPGFGGVLDVVDSLFVSAPVAYFLSILLLRICASP